MTRKMSAREGVGSVERRRVLFPLLANSMAMAEEHVVFPVPPFPPTIITIRSIMGRNDIASRGKCPRASSPLGFRDWDSQVATGVDPAFLFWYP